LVLLRRVLGVLNAAVGASPEPLRVLAHIGVIRRALERDIERDLEPETPRVRAERTKLVQRAESRVHALVAAFGGADRPWRAGVVRTGVQAIVRPFAARSTDRMNRRQIHDVETELRDVSEALPRAD